MKKIVPHNPEWAEMAAKERDALGMLLGDAVNHVHHMGSTALRNIPAKPVLDLLMEATSLPVLAARTDILTDAGYEARGAYGIEGRLYFKKRAQGETLAVHLHAYAKGDPEIERHLAFRDYLRVKPDVAQTYAALKLSLSDENGVLNSNYQDAKKSWVDQTAQEAMRFFAETD